MSAPPTVGTVAELFAARADDDNTGLRSEDSSWTWREVVTEAAARAGFLRANHRRGPFHVGVLLENVPEFLFLLGAAALAGATIVGINATRRGQELARDIRHTDCELIVTESSLAGLLDGLDTGVGRDRLLRCDSAAYARAVADHGGIASDEICHDPAALYLLLFTSGSTGAPKAVRVSQGRMAQAGQTMASGSGFGPGDVLYCAMPMFHGNALNACVVPAVASGATLALRRRFSASEFLPDVRRFGATYFNYVGRALAYVLATEPSPDDAENPLRFGFGTEASPQDIVTFGRRFACPIVEGYGSSEGAIAMSRVPGTPRHALGKPLPGMDVTVLDPVTGLERPPARFDTGGELLNATDAIGEIVSRDGVARFEGYYANEEADAERTRRGWFWSGDLGYRDADGFFYFAGRPSDWLRVDGENFAAAPLERILGRFPTTSVVAVYPVPDPVTGDQVMAAIELVPGTAFDPDAFAAFLTGEPDLGTKWAPRFVRIVGQVPTTGTNKVDKRPLRAQGWTDCGSDPLWWRPARRDGRYRLFTEADGNALRREFENNGRGAYLLPASSG
ncbi:MAG TPA: AMP-binding protein [Acidimicrobiales bacterium]|nr:AMP-binding protein [Acidimicrobiales bacterium]